MWPQIFTYMGRPLYFSTGIFFTMQSLPSGFRSLAQYIPTAHLLEWLRTGTIPGFVSTAYNPMYPIEFGAVLLAIGMTIDWVLRLIGHSDESH